MSDEVQIQVEAVTEAPEPKKAKRLRDAGPDITEVPEEAPPAAPPQAEGERWVVYHHEAEGDPYKGKFSGRRFIGSDPKEITGCWDTLDDARKLGVPGGKQVYTRREADEPSVVEVWR